MLMPRTRTPQLVARGIHEQRSPDGIDPGMPKGIPGGGSMPMPCCAGSCCAAAMLPLPPSKCTVVAPVADCDHDSDPDHFLGKIFLGRRDAPSRAGGEGAPNSRRHRR